MLRSTFTRLPPLSSCNTLLYSKSGFNEFKGKYPLSNMSSSEESSSKSSSSKMVAVFRFPLIRHCAFLTRFKLYQTTAMTLVLPPFAMWTENTLDIVPALTTATFSLLVLIAVGEWARRLVGALYVSEDGKEVMVSHLSFWGQRVDSVVAMDDVVAVGDTDEDVRAPMFKFGTYDNRGWMVSLRFGGVVHKEGFRRLLGDEALDEVLQRERGDKDASKSDGQ